MLLSVKPEVSIIIVTYNALNLIDRCLAALTTNGGASEVNHEIIIVDNASSDDTITHVKATWCKHYPQIKLIDAKVNGGMAAGNNIGMQAAQGDYFLLLNSDAFLHEGALKTLLSQAKSSDTALAAIFPMLRNEDGSLQRSIRSFPTVWRYITEFIYLRRIAPKSRLFNSFYGAGVEISQPQEIDWATGACFLVPRSVVDTVGLMDENYFMYGEEVDWLKRMRKSGYVAFWTPQAEVTHVGGGSAGNNWGALYQRQLKNHVRYMLLNEGESAARRTRSALIWSLRIRRLIYRLLILFRAGANARIRHRYAAYANGVSTLKALQFKELMVKKIPRWDIDKKSVG